MIDDLAFTLRRLKWKARRDEPSVVRIEGRALCPMCGVAYRDHPDDDRAPFPTFVAMCDGLIGKT